MMSCRDVVFGGEWQDDRGGGGGGGGGLERKTSNL